ncbi:MAG: hypothetical protein Q8877_02685, partial [Sweet potato little leaf phytoplasma]|nr:hypothetical protein [Sweet potato little leaf phytoplasma]
KIRLSSPHEIRQKSYGEVVNYETINYRTAKPEKGGLFCPIIFSRQKSPRNLRSLSFKDMDILIISIFKFKKKIKTSPQTLTHLSLIPHFSKLILSHILTSLFSLQPLSLIPITAFRPSPPPSTTPVSLLKAKGEP